MKIILKINVKPIFTQLYERKIEPGGERKGAGRGQGGACTVVALQEAAATEGRAIAGTR